MALTRFVSMMVLSTVPLCAQTLCATVTGLTNDPAAAAAHWGVAVMTLDGTLVCGVNEGQLFRPASNNKIFTTATALALLGPAKTVETRVTGRLDAATGVVTGDLKLVGAGDANLDSNDLPYLPPSQRPKVPVAPPRFRDLEELAAQLVAKGVKSVAGDVVGDDTYFPYEPYPPSWNGDDFVWGYGAPVSALTIADNELKLTTTPGSKGAMATVVLEQNGVDFYTVQAQVTTVAARQPDGVQVERLPGSRVIRVYGSIAADSRADVEEVAISDPALYAAMAFKDILLAHGIAVGGAAVAKHRPDMEGRGFTAQLLAAGGPEQAVVTGGIIGGSCMATLHEPVLATHVSATLVEDVTYTDKVSQNLHAELLLHRLGYAGFCGSGANVAGARMVRAYVTHAGVQGNDFMLYDGSGLSDHDLIAPRALAKLLTFAAGQPWFEQFKAALPDAGVDGTLASRFKPPIAFKVSAKTGTLGESRAISGYATTAAGKTFVFSVMVDTHLPTTSADRGVMDRIVEAIAGGN